MQPQKEATLAGLGFSFEPVQLKLRGSKASAAKAPGDGRPASSGRPGSGGRPSSGRPGSSGGSQLPQEQPPPPKAVSFNLKQRRPGAAYSSPQQASSLAAAGRPVRPRSADGPRSGNSQHAADLRRSWPVLHSGSGGSGDIDTAVHLLQSLKGSPAAAAATPPAESTDQLQHPSGKAAGLARLKQAAMSRRRVGASEAPSTAEPAGEAGGQEELEPEGEAHVTHTFAAEEATDEDAELLHRAEQLLAGCVAGPAGEEQQLSRPPHLQLASLPERRWAEEEVQEEEQHLGSNLGPGDVGPDDGPGRSMGGARNGIAAYRPEGCLPAPAPGSDEVAAGEDNPSFHRVHAILSTITYPSSPLAGRSTAGAAPDHQLGPSQPLAAVAAEAGREGGWAGPPRPAAETATQAGWAGCPVPPADDAAVELHKAPTTLQEALTLLGLLEEGGASTMGSPQQQAVYLAPLWLKLRAAAVVHRAKQLAGQHEMKPLLARLRHVRANLEFHKANVARGRSRTPPRQRPAPAEQPWLAGTRGSAISKHRRARSNSPGLQLPPRPKVGPTPQETSELQVKLLSGLLPKLWLKLGLLALRHAAALARLRERLLQHIELTEAGKLCIRVVRGWRGAAIPSAGMVAAADDFHRGLQRRQKQLLLQSWQAWARHRRWQQGQVWRGLKVYQHQLKMAAMSHWRLYCQERHVQRLQQALAARWVAAWTKRKVFTVWRLAARRAALQKHAMKGHITGASRTSTSRSGSSAGSEDVAARPPAGHLLPTLGASLAATSTAFQAVKDFVSTARQELEQLRGRLRFGRQWQQLDVQQEEQEQEEPPRSPSPTPVGSLQALLAMLQQPEQQRQQRQSGEIGRLQPLQLPGGWGSSSPDFSPTGEPTSAGASGPAPGWSTIDAGSPGVGWQSGRPGSATSSPGHSPAYNPARYVSPTKLPGRLPSVHHPQAIQAELEGVMAAVAHISQELEAFEQEAAMLQQQQEELEQQQRAAQHQAVACREGSQVAEQAKQLAAQHLQAKIDKHTEASTLCTSLERQAQQHERVLQQAVGNEVEARAAANAAAEEQATAAISIQKCSRKVEAIAKELQQCHRSQQPAVAAQLRDARQQLQQQQAAATALGAEVGQLNQVAQQAAEQVERAQQALSSSRAQVDAALAARSLLQQEISELMQAHERHAVEAVAKEQEATAAEQQQRLLTRQQRLVSERLQDIASAVLARQQDAQQLKEGVAELERLQSQAAAAVVASAEPKRRSQQRTVAAPSLSLSSSDSQCSAPQAPSAAPAANWPVAGTCVLAAPAQLLLQPQQQQQGALVCQPGAGKLAACPSSDGSELSSLPSSSWPPSPPAPRTVGELAQAFFRTRMLRHAFLALQHEAARTREHALQAEQHFAWCTLSKCLGAWRQRAEEARLWLGEVQPVLRRRGCLRRWMAWAREQQRLRQCEEQLAAVYHRRLLLRGFLGLRAHADHQKWRDAVHEAVVRLRWRNTLQGWRQWARQQRVEEASLQRARDVHNRQLLAEAWRQWSWVAHKKALLRRVFDTAAELWREEVGALLHSRNYQKMGEAFRAWQLHVLERQEQRRQQILWNAAVAFREKQLLLAGMQAFRGAVSAAHERRRLKALQAEMFLEWRRLAANSPRHWDLVLAANQRRRRLLQDALVAWREACSSTAHLLARFWLRWQVQMLLHRAFVVWRAIARFQRHQAQQKAVALAFRRLILLWKTLNAWKASVAQLRERRILRGMAEAHYRNALSHKALAALRSAAEAAAAARRQQEQQQVERQQQQWRQQGHRAVWARDENSPAASAPLAAAVARQRSNWRGSVGSTRGAPSPHSAPTTAHKQTSTQPTSPSGLQHLMAPKPQQGPTTVVIVHRSNASPPRRPSAQQLARQQVAQQHQVAGSGPAAGNPEVLAMLQSVEQWKGTADYWRQRLAGRAASPTTGPAAKAAHTSSP